jgi:hypothetical protein
MAGLDPACVEPFEISSIRPPTENYSLTFRLSRNCGWNRCLFCPAYRLGAQFSRRGLDDVKRDVDRAKVIYELLLERGLGAPYVARGGSQEVATLIEEIHTARTRVEETGKGTLTSGQHGALQQNSLLSSPECSTGQGDEEMA